MTPNFALTLSFDGIQLLHKAEDGWHIIGGVEVDDPGFTEKLADLRAQAEAIEGGPIQTKLLISNEQIKFMAIDSTMTTESDVKAALDGATPYQVNELVIDHDRSGGRTHIAAVAKETLQEAEDFATQHGFNPVAFTAIGKPFTFRHEVFFGMTEAAASLLPEGVTVEAAEPVKIVGKDDAPAATKKKKKAKAAVKDASDQAAAERAPNTIADVPDPNEAEVQFSRRKDAPVLTATRDSADVTPIGSLDIGKVSDSAPAIGAASTAAALAAARPPMTDLDLEMEPIPPSNKPAVDPDALLNSTSKSGDRGKPRYLGLILTGCLLVFLFFVALWANTLTEDGIAGWFKRSSDLVELQEPTIEPEMIAAPIQAPLPKPDEASSPTVPSPSLPIVRAPTGRVLSPAEADRIYAATGVYQRAPRLPITPRENDIGNLITGRALLPASSQPLPAFPAQAQVEPDPSITSPRNPPPAGTRYLRDLRGFILAMPEGVLTPDGALVISGEPDLLPPARPGTELLPLPTVASAPVDPDAFRLIGGRPPIEPPLRPEGLAPEDVSEVAAEPVEDSVDPPVDVAEPIADLLDETIEQIDPITDAAEPIVDVAEPDAEGAQPVTEAIEPVTEGTAPAADVLEPIIEGIEQATDIPEPVEQAVVEVVDSMPFAVADPALVLEQNTELASAITQSSDLANIQELLVVTLDENAAASSEDATSDTIEPVVVVPGRPSLEPPARPSAFADLVPDDIASQPVEPQLQLVVDPAVVGFRPSQRPTGLVSEAVLAALTRDIPARPSNLAPVEPEPVAEPEIEEVTPDESGVSAVAAAIAAATPEVPFSNVTALAISTSPRPDQRPRNFSQVVARAQAASASRPQVVAAAPTSSLPAAASGPIPGGVARAATVDNAIRLRDVNLIGVYGRPNDRRALVRLGNGRFVKVEVGSSLDGGRVTAINDTALNYVKRGRTLLLQLPSG